jgi:acetone carboxylase gamma subunit
MKINAYLEIIKDTAGNPVIRCRKCSTDLGPAAQSYKAYAKERRRPISQAGVQYVARGRQDNPFELREYYCPSCFVLLDTDVARQNDPVLHDVELRIV